MIFLKYQSLILLFLCYRIKCVEDVRYVYVIMRNMYNRCLMKNN